jgi:MoxR-like ATPase
LPEAQLDRFLVKIRIDYAPAEQETEILSRYQAGFDARNLGRAGIDPVEAGLLAGARAEVASVRVEPALLRYITEIARKTRSSPAVSLGASPRAAVNLMLVAKAVAATDGRDYLIPDDVKAATPPVLRHRLVLKPEADLEGVTSDQVIGDVLAAVEVPK